MRLLPKIMLIFLGTSLVVFLIGYLISVEVIQREMDREEQRFLKERLTHAEKYIREHMPEEKVEWNKLTMEPLGKDTSEMAVTFSDTMVVHSQLERQEPHLKLDVIREIKGNYYYISIYDLIIEEEDVQEGVREALIKMYLLLFVVVSLLTWFLSRRILNPFNDTLEKIRNFRLRSEEPLSLQPVNTREFDRLNRFLEEMAEKSRKDYQALREFTENASHEMQTPLSIAKNKLELLLESEGLTEEQVKNILSAQQSIKRLSKLGNTLSVLNKIDNREYFAETPLNLSSMLENLLFDMQELIELKGITVDKSVEQEVYVKLHEVSAEMLVTNLLQNAIRHNTEGGHIKLILTSEKLVIGNTGRHLEGDPTAFFDRFKKNSTQKESLGLGLSIVYTICRAQGIQISYTHHEGWHEITLIFPGEHNA